MENPKPCPRCDGTGFIHRNKEQAAETKPEKTPCPICKGKGEI